MLAKTDEQEFRAESQTVSVLNEERGAIGCELIRGKDAGNAFSGFDLPPSGLRPLRLCSRASLMSSSR